MEQQAITFLICVFFFGAAGFAAWWLCERFKMPVPVYWLVGGILLIILVFFIAREAGLSSGGVIFQRR